ncbi:Calcium-transporting ATPase [Neomoorella glycerini]|uniref:Calcium-transporting ATPase n=1 Tax=Neomoorella glycerini TaxID=55779 RepID=A0A6I5ZTE6_9FIRM|nr:cation-translocating P-type ATPase [Moorella glycerini]QGP92968.1 Calcium-transporting ATPase [Moorella glycerini]
MQSRLWYQLSPGEALEALQTDAGRGLAELEARRRLGEAGPNQLKAKPKVPPYRIFLAQFQDFMVLVLLAATAVSAFLGETADAITIVAIVVINAILGFVQEYRAERSLEALKEMTAPEARVRRDNEVRRVPARDIVPGDILLLESGDRVAADALLLKAVNLQADEAALTGESVPVHKEPGPLRGTVAVGDRRNMIHQGTVITSGRGEAVVVATGMNTEVGRIAGMLQEVADEDTPLQKRLASLGRWLVLACLAICATVVIIGTMRGEELYGMFLAGVSLAVAAIPEGLPAIVTVCLALGVQKMVQRNAIIRKLPAVETLGCATVICSDKTGTLTQNQMTVRRVWAGGKSLMVSGTGYIPQGEYQDQGRRVAVDGDLKMLLTIAALCNNALLQKAGLTIGGWLRRGNGREKAGEGQKTGFFSKMFGGRNGGSWSISGDPTEGALLVAAAKGGLWRERLEGEEPRVAEIPFDSDRKRMSVICRAGRGLRAYVKGAPDVILDLCDRILIDGRVLPLDAARRELIRAENEAMAGQALRVLALAYRDLEAGEEIKGETVEKNLILVGLMGMLDPPRPEAAAAIRVCHQAGIKVVMITGDHQVTARAVARELGLPAGAGQVLNGRELETMNDTELAGVAPEVNVYARVSPHHKLRIVRALKANGHIVAMTGDGVNDAPAIKEADIGIAMGRSGTDVAREAAAMVLADDNFATIVAAVEEGRGIYDNIRKFIRYLLSCNIGEVFTMFVAVISGLPLPLLPIQILWMNLVTDGLPAMALGVDNKEPGLMQRPPHPPGESVFARGLGKGMVVLGLQIGLATLAVFILGLYLGDGDLITARTLAFTTLVMAQLFAVFECRSEYLSPFAVGYFSNPYLVLAVACSVTMQLLVLYIPLLQAVFKTAPLNSFHWGIVLLAAGWRTLLQAISLYLVVPVWRLVWQR